MLKVMLFAGLAEAAGSRSVQFEIGLPVKVSEVKRLFSERYPEAARQAAASFAAINQEYASDEAWIEEGDEVALLPPVSGG